MRGTCLALHKSTSSDFVYWISTQKPDRRCSTSDKQPTMATVSVTTLLLQHLDYQYLILIMPWQSAPALLVVGGMFNVVAGLVSGIHYLSEGVSSKSPFNRMVGAVLVAVLRLAVLRFYLMAD